MSEYNPEHQPFETALRHLPLGREIMRGALVDVADTVDMAKRILLQHRVRDFKAGDVVELTRIILDRENVLALREREE